MLTAFVLINADVHSIPETAQAVADIDGVTEVYSCAGDVDLIAKVRVRDHDAIAEVVTNRINRLQGVRASTTHIAFRSYASLDTEAGFAVGE
ncbi:MAG TPA: Lrp/AsnC ligand binding domain-containing protein [Gordonia sp. (in: high G+C Gram-positive bacteria)]|uniref:Lrp/AsnC family transcriptional regulator n=1 Tax=unclassified Gordonia (in: high G+C Gram-positive bacteria) TaxID=2657482 RepID=UPI0025BF95F3|nr:MULTISPECIES: Lrp/AsnC ligand binding domain-containing protein [unclassified Gordonia (in: high G+C Gram-positive bacteria)]HNP58316.1 Lrp/AsnC ligand binding domain-containing protein [Gordonia sp. (in: high G+C Gram-positive bacteria)]HRC51139.1 Lrp/AsnC ligand binding domain-containing protein [Gordonia sp. (in: high G+C Gram-positive bacteria)]